MARDLAPGTVVRYRDTVWEGRNGPLHTGTVELATPDMIRFEGGDICYWEEVVDVVQ